LLYALLDCSQEIKLEHLEAAPTFWAYSAASARWVFGDSIGDPTADEIWAMARERHDGITRTEVSNLFSRNKKAHEIDRALRALIDAGRLECAIIRDLRTDRPVTVWRPVPIGRYPATAPSEAAAFSPDSAAHHPICVKTARWSLRDSRRRPDADLRECEDPGDPGPDDDWFPTCPLRSPTANGDA
jgi:hypothetical protein